MDKENAKAEAFMKKLMIDSASSDSAVATAATREMAQALTTPLRRGIQSGDILGNIFETITLEPGSLPEFPLDFLAPGTERDFVAFTVPNHGRIPEKAVEGDYVMVPTYTIADGIDWLTDYARMARWDIVGRAMKVLQGSFVKKMNDDGWHTILAAGVDRNIVVYDSDATAGLFTKRLVSLAKTIMRRNGGGNSTSQNRGKLTDLYISPEGVEDIRNWGVDQVDEVTRRDIFVSEDTLSRIFGVNIVDLDELGEGQEYQLYYENELGGSLQSADLELGVGLDLSTDDSFVMPIRQQLEINDDDTLKRQLRTGLWGVMQLGFGVLDNRRAILVSY